MLYAIVENLIFLLIAALLGGIIGWLLRAPRLRKQLEEIWRRRVDEEHEGRKRGQLQLSEAREALSEAETRAESLDKKRDKAERALQGASEQAATAEQSAQSVEQEKAALAADLKAARETTGKAEQAAKQQAAKLKEAEQRAKATGAALEQARGRLSEAETEAKALARKLEIEAAERQGQAEQLASAEAELTACRERIAALEAAAAAPAPTAAEPEADLADDQASARAAVEAIARRTAGEVPAADDDLKRIKGIGPVLERQLKAMGITSFRQIAQFSDDDIDRVSAALGAFRGRILRDNWPEGARAAHRDQYGEEA